MESGPSGSTGAPEFETRLVTVLDQAYGTALRLTGNAADAEDLVQDAALLAHRGFGGFRPDSNFRAWFFRILLNRFYSDYRKRRRGGATVELEEVPEHYLYQRVSAEGLVQEADPAAALMGRLDEDLITAAMDALPEEFRSVATLYFMQDLPYQEIAEVLEIPVGTVRSRLHRARRHLQVALWRLAEERGLVRGERRP